MPEICPYCFSTAHIKSSTVIYGRYCGKALICDAYPACDAYALHYHKGCYMADAETRALRKECHDQHFDPLWQFGGYSRTGLYKRLRKLLKLSPTEAHFGKLNKEQCLQFITAIRDGSFIK